MARVEPEANIEQTAAALKAAGVTPEKAKGMSHQQKVEAAESKLGGKKTDHNNTTTALRGMRRRG